MQSARVVMPASGVAAAKSGRTAHGCNSNNTRRDASSRDRGASPDGEDYIDTRPVEALLPLSEIRLIDGRKVEEVAAELLESEKNRGWVIDPRRSKFIMYWDIITSVALVFTATVTPYEVALLDPRMDVLWIINRLVDSIFGLDIILAFFTMYEVKSASIAQHNEWVSSHWRIAKHYITGWFALDVFSVGVSAVDIYSVISQLTGRVVDLGELSSLKTLRVLRLFKLIRLVRRPRALNSDSWRTLRCIHHATLSHAALSHAAPALLPRLRYCTSPPSHAWVAATGIPGSPHLAFGAAAAAEPLSAASFLLRPLHQSHRPSRPARTAVSSAAQLATAARDSGSPRRLSR